VHALNDHYKDIGGVLFVKDGAILVCYPAGNQSTSYAIPSSVTSVNEWAFDSCTSLVSIAMPDSVTDIGHRAFFYCTSLTSIAIPGNVTSIGDSAFVGCSSLTSITIDAHNNHYEVVNGALRVKGGTEIIWRPPPVLDKTALPMPIDANHSPTLDRICVFCHNADPGPTQYPLAPSWAGSAKSPGPWTIVAGSDADHTGRFNSSSCFVAGCHTVSW